VSAPRDTYRLVLLHDIMGAAVAIPIRRILNVEAVALPRPVDGGEVGARVTLEPIPRGTGVIEKYVRETPERIAKLVTATLNGWTP
jgi:hypothetical protein